MTSKLLTTTTALAGMMLSAALNAQPAERTRCDSPQDVADRTACAKAKEGPGTLRRYIERTQSVYGLYFFDYAPRDETWWKADAARRTSDMPIDVARADKQQ